jgi:hypothetical protein
MSSEDIRALLAEGEEDEEMDEVPAVRELELLAEKDFHIEEEEDEDDYVTSIVNSLTTTTPVQTVAAGSQPNTLPQTSQTDYYDLKTPAVGGDQKLDVGAGTSAQPDVVAGPSTSSDAVRASVRERKPASYVDLSSDEDSDDDEEEVPLAQRFLRQKPMPRRCLKETPEPLPAVASMFTDRGSKKLIQPLSKREVIPWDGNDKGPILPLVFKPRNAGIQVEIPEDFDELAALMLFLRSDIWEIMATETNRYYKNREAVRVQAGNPTHAQHRH